MTILVDPGRNPVILVVDDQFGVRWLLCEVLKGEDYKVKLAGNGLEAIEEVKKEVPDLIIMDIKMPGMNGLETLREIKKLNYTGPVIFITAYGELGIINQAKKLGVKHYITKPFDINELRQLVQLVLYDHAVSDQVVSEL